MRHKLLAKSSRCGTEKTLYEHTKDVIDAARSLFGTAAMPTRLGQCWLRFFRIDPPHWNGFFANLIAACALHDWGKANEGMQKIFVGEKSGQLFRHEHLSVLLMATEEVHRWLRQREDIDWDVVLAAVGSHHLKFDDRTFAEETPGEAVEVCFDHPDFTDRLLPLITDCLGLRDRPTIPREKFWGFTNDTVTFDPTELRESLKDGRLRKLTRTCDNLDHSQARMLRVVRAALIAADGAGSGLPRTGRTINEWIEEQFNESKLCDEGAVWSLIQNRIDDLTGRGKWTKWNEFQDQCEKLPERALLLAPCGAGKTLAAWRWIASRTKNCPVKRVLFLYPTRATATEGFKDYVSWAPGDDAALLHGTADYDLEDMFAAEDPRHGNRFGTDPRLFALRFWSKQVFSATVDQFMAFMTYAYGPVCLLPVLADSVVVIDEVHSFDRRMFSALLGFLTSFDVPVLCMTATLPEPRQTQLSDAGLSLSNPKPDDLTRIADAPRYRVSRIDEANVADRVRASLEDGKRVLWVLNQVSRAQVRTKELAADFRPLDGNQRNLCGPAGVQLLCYHSRFRLNDRVYSHRQVIDAIRPGAPPALAVTTQICEMSLDIDADILVTEECPITSLIQRMGRCRRGGDEFAAKGPGEVLVYKPRNEKVYKSGDLSGLGDFIDFITKEHAVSQTDLETGLDRFGPRTSEAPKLNSFLASGPYAVGGEDPFRDIEPFNVQAVLSGDLERYLNARREAQPGFVLPVPEKVKCVPDKRLPRYLAVADDGHYHAATGFWDEPLR